MKLIQTSNFNFPNHGIPHESNLNLIGLTLTSRKIKHQLPVSLNIDPQTYVSSLDKKLSDSYANSLRELFDLADSLAGQYKVVEASVHLLGKMYKITFLCYGD